MASSLPYHTSPGRLRTVLESIKKAATPAKLTQDVLHNTLGAKGGAADACIPILKRIGFLQADATPTKLYANFRGKSGGTAMATAIQTGYAPLFEANESAHTLNDDDLRALIVQVTGQGAEARSVEFTALTFKILKEFADFASKSPEPAKHGTAPESPDRPDETPLAVDGPSHRRQHLGLSYTIYLNLPNTTDISVFNSIFKSLRDNLLR